MYLKSLTLKGFKSFASATTLKFEPGICAVVGPNGSGKSNVVDALAWVMGEQGAKTLRGGKMEDVIFAGAGDRKPLGRAEVTLTIDNSDGALDIAYSEVSVTRRMFRDGASEYEINGTKARLMDIQELLSDSGIGREMHVIVGQGRLAQILESRPEDRRAFIEEAAGVLKHRRRKEKAQRKLVSMQANLDRLSDLTAELRRQLKPLARQAEAARRAATVQADVRDARLKLAGHRLVELQEALGSAESQARMLLEQVEDVTAQLETATESQVAIEDELELVVPQAEHAQQIWFELSSLVERISATIRIAADRKNSFQETAYTGPDPDDLVAKAQRADTEYEELAAQAAIAAERLESIQEEVYQREAIAQEADREHLAQVRAIADRREGVVRLLAQEESVQAQLKAARDEVARHDELLESTLERTHVAQQEVRECIDRINALVLELEPLRDEHIRSVAEAEAAENRLDQLRDEQRALERNVSGLQSRIDTLSQQVGQETVPISEVLDGADCTSIAHYVKPKPGAPAGVDKALSAALGSCAEAVTGSRSLFDVLKAATAIPRTAVVITDPATGVSDWHIDATLPGAAQWLLEHVCVDKAVRSAVYRMLADVVFCSTLDHALAVVTADERLRAVTPTGEIVGHNWAELGQGSRSPVELAAEIDADTAKLAEIQGQLTGLSATLEGAKQTAAESRVAAAGATSALREQEAVLEQLRKDQSRLEAQYHANKKEHERTAQQAVQAELRVAELSESLTQVTDRLARVESDTTDEEPSTQARDEAAAALAQVKAMEMEARLEVRTTEERAEAIRDKGDNLRRQAEHERAAKARHEQANKRRRHQAEVAKVVETCARDLYARTLDATERATANRDELHHQRTGLQTKLSTAKDSVNALRTQLNRLTDTAHNSEIARSQAQVRLEEAQAKLVEQLGVPVADIIRDYSPGPDFDLAEETARLRQAEKDLSALGKVNPLALEEFKALEERYEFLATQLADVEQARKDLTDVIEEVDAKILQLFTDAWHDVAAEFPQVFSTLFPGGEGRLVLTEPESMLTTGIEVEARPPGKKVKRLSLLSGGEKSLTALAMLVAIFRARPSPFYVMDEVEAALDDVNLRRLIALFEQLRKDSQLIVITHQKPTMDVANVLYGVTMRGDGVTRVISQRMTPSS